VIFSSKINEITIQIVMVRKPSYFIELEITKKTIQKSINAISK
jgi:hypothetical protein